MSPEYREARRRGIIGAARAVFAERGFANTSMSDLVGATGLSIGALYSYFPSKTDIVMAVVEGRDGVVDDAVADQELPSEMLRRYLSYVTPKTEESLTQARLATQTFGEAVANVELTQPVRDTVHALHGQLAGRLAATGEHRAPQNSAAERYQCDDDVFADFLIAALAGFTSLVAIGYPIDVDAFERTLQRVFAETCS
ncbi:TetR/AcrR family transcriptional regulator [Amycolatopsis japonica]|uniref:TetR/AcrR family transcriptional regulator n=1 Tax=Amycolatopsis japonica TaxID=208439 RepID=UPI0036708C08